MEESRVLGDLMKSSEALNVTLRPTVGTPESCQGTGAVRQPADLRQVAATNEGTATSGDHTEVLQ